MKTIQEWFEEGITRVRNPKWNEWAYLEAREMKGCLEPWVYLFDVGCPGKPILIFNLLDEQFEQWTPPEDYDTRKDEIYFDLDKLIEKEKLDYQR